MAFRDQIFKPEILSLPNPVYKLEISSLETRNFAFTKSKFGVWKLVSVKCRLQTRGKMQINVII